MSRVRPPSPALNASPAERYIKRTCSTENSAAEDDRKNGRYRFPLRSAAMPRLSDTAVPAYRLHKASGQAVVTLDGHDFYLGVYKSAASKSEYSRLAGEWLVAGRQLPSDPNSVTV